MAKIKIKALPKNVKISKEEIRRVAGGAAYIKFYGIGGEAQEKYHKGWIDLYEKWADIGQMALLKKPPK
jgi:hypothetical protein